MAGRDFEIDIKESDARRFMANSEDALDTLENAGPGKEADAVAKDERSREVTNVEGL